MYIVAGVIKLCQLLVPIVFLKMFPGVAWCDMPSGNI
jgi:hypothetical protein